MFEDARIEPNFDEDDDHVVLVPGAIRRRLGEIPVLPT
jgi:hypothetical protein